MSDTLIVDLKNSELSFDKLNALAKAIIQFCLDNDIAALFNKDRAMGLVKSANMKNYFLMSDSFLYDQGDELLSTESCLDIAIEYDSELEKKIKINGDKLKLVKENVDKKFRKEFYKKFAWFNGLLNIIFRYDITSIDIYIEGYEPYPLNDYFVIRTNCTNFLKDVCDDIISESNTYYYDTNTYCYEFPFAVKFEISK